MSTPFVVFVGAGPGAEDLITLRGERALQQADVVLYAGSLVNPGHLARCKEGCLCSDSAPLSLDEQVAVMAEAALAGKYVVRLHTGDPSLYGAINEQIRRLAELGIEAQLVPGVSSVFGAAAALGCELTSPEVSQSVVLTRTPGRTPMPDREKATVFAQTGATLVFFLSTGSIAELMTELRAGGLSPETPAAVVYRATWPDERILRGTVGDIAEQVEEAGFGRQALIFVGEALRASAHVSRLYDAAFSHGYRNRLPSEAFTGRCALYAFTDRGVALARELAAGLSGGPEGAEVFSTRAGGDVQVAPAAFNSMLADNWKRFAAHIFVGATGIAVRKIAPLLKDKTSDPAVLCCSERGAHVISLTSGHLGGANRLARRVARITGGQAVISTATDVNGLPAFDEAAAQEQARVLNREAIQDLNAALLSGETISFCGSQVLFERYFAACPQIVYAEPADVVTKYAVLWDAEQRALPSDVRALALTSKVFVLGIGCRRGVDSEELRQTAESFLARQGLVPGQVAEIVSCDVKADEPALGALSAAWHVPAIFYPREVLEPLSVPNPSERVREKIGISSVCEAAVLYALKEAGQEERLLVPKTIFPQMTLALGQLSHMAAGPRRGGVVVVGLGSGCAGQITPEVDAALHECDTVAGYTAYVDFVRARLAGKKIIQNGMRGEVERCRDTLRAAQAGEQVCMVCSGDPGILAMAGLLFELRVREPEFAGIPIRVLPGITSASLAAASLGAPLQNGFSLVSLSDLLVPTEEVLRNVRAVAQSALPVALYNPAGRKRRQLLEQAVDLFTAVRGPETWCAYVRHAGRPDEHKWIGQLGAFPGDEVDMSTLVLIGGPRTVFDGEALFEARGYADKYLNRGEA